MNDELVGRAAAGGDDAPEISRRESLIVASPLMHRFMDSVRRAATRHSRATILLIGETGTGKELIAREIHEASRRRRRHRFVPLNCAGLNQDLAEAELYGHEQGAYTGAVRSRPGLFRAASGGTLFLDEISLMPIAVQGMLLRALEVREIRSVGSTEAEPVDVRVVAATSRDLLRLVGKRKFLQDLFYRLDALSLAVPPLRDRTEDIAALAPHFLALEGFPEKRFSPEALRALRAYPWPGNVRELRQAVLRLAIETDEQEIGHTAVEKALASAQARHAIPPAIPPRATAAPPASARPGDPALAGKARLAAMIKDVRTAFIRELADRHRHNILAMAAEMKWSYKSMRRHYRDVFASSRHRRR